MKTCGDLMTLDLRWISSNASALEAAQIMRESSIGFLPICEPASGRVVAVVTDRDLVVRLCALNARPSEVNVASVATSGPVTCYEETDLSLAEAAMSHYQISRVVVVDRELRPVGVLSLTDILLGDRDRRGLSTARNVLEREAGSPQPSSEGVSLMADAQEDTQPGDNEPSAEEVVEGSATAADREGYIIGGRETREMKEFPR